MRSFFLRNSKPTLFWRTHPVKEITPLLGGRSIISDPLPYLLYPVRDSLIPISFVKSYETKAFYIQYSFLFSPPANYNFETAQQNKCAALGRTGLGQGHLKILAGETQCLTADPIKKMIL